MSMLSELMRPGNGSGGQDNRFIVTLTPMNYDYSGEMDKTVSEITEAWQAGKQIWFSIALGEMGVDVQCTEIVFVEGFVYPSFCAYVVETGNNLLVYAHTNATNDETVDAYDTEIYALTPANA